MRLIELIFVIQVYEQKFKEAQEKYRKKLESYQQTDEYKQHQQNKKAAKFVLHFCSLNFYLNC